MDDLGSGGVAKTAPPPATLWLPPPGQLRPPPSPSAGR